MAKQLFGTDGIRGIPGEYPLDDATLVRTGLALGDYLRKGGTRARVLIGRDTRESGPHIAERIARGLETAGAQPVSAGVLTTPGVAWLVHHERFAAGVVISASHNPYHDNGVKLISSSGMKFPDAVEVGSRNSFCRAISRFRSRPGCAPTGTRTFMMITWPGFARRCFPEQSLPE